MDQTHYRTEKRRTCNTIAKDFDFEMNLPIPQSITEKQVKSNYLALLDRVAAASKKTSRPPNEVKVVGVTKYVDVNLTQFLVNAGCQDLAESRPQALWEKSATLASNSIHWHLIGHLQRNKAKRTIPILNTIHSLDSLRILQQIESDLAERESPLRLLLEVNVAGEENKTGMTIHDAELLLANWVERESKPKNLEISGLMAMGSLSGIPDTTRREFSKLRELRNAWNSRFGLPLNELSMGMSDDFEIAIEEGSTMIRIGSLLFTSSADE